MLRLDKFYDTFFNPPHFTITKTLKKPHNTTDSHHSSRQKHQERKEGQRSGRWWRHTLHVQTCSSRNRIIPLMQRSNTDSRPSKPVTLPHNQLSIRYKCVPTFTVLCSYVFSLLLLLFFLFSSSFFFFLNITLIFLSCRDANSRLCRIYFPSIINAVYFSVNIIRVIK